MTKTGQTTIVIRRSVRQSGAGSVEGAMTTVVGGAVILGLTWLAVWNYERSLRRPGGRDGLGSTADMMGNFIDVFHPDQSRATQALKEIEHSGPVTPTPDDDDQTLRLLTHPDGRPRAVRIRRR